MNRKFMVKVILILALLIMMIGCSRGEDEANGTDSEVEPTAVITEGSPIAAEGSPIAAEVTPIPAEATPIPAEATPIPAEVTPIPAEVTPIPAEVTPIPAEVTPIPAEVTLIPAEVTPIPAEVTLIPAEVTPIPAEVTPIPADVTPIPEQPGEQPAEQPGEQPINLSGEWEFSLTVNQWLYSDGRREDVNIPASVAATLNQNETQISGQFIDASIEGIDDACREASINGSIQGNQVNWTMSYSGTCCPGQQISFQGSYDAVANTLTGNFTPLGTPQPNCRPWFANVTGARR